MRGLVLAVVLALPAAADVSSAPSRCGNRIHGIELKLSLSKAEYAVGDKIPFTWALVNHSVPRGCFIPRNWNCVFPLGEDFVHGAEGRIEFRPAGKPWPSKGEPIACGSGLVRTFATLKTKVRRTDKVTVDPQTRLPEGVYDVRLIYYCYSKGLISESPDDMVSNVVRIRVGR